MFRLPRPAIAGLCTLAAAVLTISLLHTVSAQVVPPAVATNKTGYLAGETVVIGGVGFTSGDVVTLRVMHADGTSEAGGNHDAFTAVASDAGEITASWALGAGPTEDLAGNEFVLTASTVAGALAPVAFSRIAVIGTDKYDYQPGETVVITGGGFRGSEFVTLQVLHTSGLNDSAAHLPFEGTGRMRRAKSRLVGESNRTPLGSYCEVQAVGAESGLRAVTAFTDAFLTFPDDQGPDDEPGQKDLSYLQFEETNPNPNYAVRWAWDDTGFSGNNSGDGCVLFDTNANGFADQAVCVSIKNTPATLDALTVYTCEHDSRSDRCAGPELVPTNGTTAQASVVANVDPFRTNPLHTTGNTCSVTTGCYTDDTVADVSITPADAGGSARKADQCLQLSVRAPQLRSE